MRDIKNIYLQRTKRRWLVSCLTALIGGPLMCLCLVLLNTTFLPALDQLYASGDPDTSMLVIVGAGLLVMMLMIFIPLVVMTVLTLRRNRQFDAIFTPLGMTGSMYMLTGRQYHGQVSGRKVNVYIYRGPAVEVRLENGVQSQVQIVRGGSLPSSVAGLLNKNPLETNDPALADLSIYPHDPHWTLNLFADPRAVDAAQTLMNVGAGWAIFRRVEIQPGEVSLHLNRSKRVTGNSLDLTDMPAWLNALQSLAQAAESQPAPETPVPAQGNGSPASRQAMSTFLLYAIVFIVFVMPLCFIGIGVLAYLLVSIP